MHSSFSSHVLVLLHLFCITAPTHLCICLPVCPLSPISQSSIHLVYYLYFYLSIYPSIRIEDTSKCTDILGMGHHLVTRTRENWLCACACECVCLCMLFKSSKTNICLLLYLGENYESESHSVLLYSLRTHGLFSPWNFPGQNTGLGSLSLLQGIFPTHGSNCRRILYQLNHKGSSKTSS